MKKIQEYETVRYIGPFNRSLALAPGEIGTVLDEYGDGSYEVDFPFPDGTTWLQCALLGTSLQPEPENSVSRESSPSQTGIYPAILAFENGDTGVFHYAPTGEMLSVQRIEDGRITVTTPSLGIIAVVTRPER